MACLVYRIVVDLVVRRYSRHTAEGVAESIRMAAGEEGAVDSRSPVEVEEDRSFVVGSSLAGVSTAVVGVLRILRGIQLQDNQTCLCELLWKNPGTARRL